MTDKKQELEDLFKQHYRQMYQLANELLHDEAESQDVVHDVFVQLLTSPREVRADGSEAFLKTCVRNRCLNLLRDRQIQERIRRQNLPADEPTDNSADPLGEEQRLLREGISSLQPAACREVVELHYSEGLTFREIAHRMGVSETTVYKRLRRALQQLRTHLAAVAVVLLLSTVALATIHLMSRTAAPDSQPSATPPEHAPATGSPAVDADTTALPQTKRYDNVPLELILADLADRYPIQVVYRTDEARRLRLFFQLRPEYTLEKVVEMLNHFEWLQLQLSGDTLFVATTADATVAP